jgi:hypothetical protein
MEQNPVAIDDFQVHMHALGIINTAWIMICYICYICYRAGWCTERREIVQGDQDGAPL